MPGLRQVVLPAYGTFSQGHGAGFPGDEVKLAGRAVFADETASSHTAHGV